MQRTLLLYWLEHRSPWSDIPFVLSEGYYFNYLCWMVVSAQLISSNATTVPDKLPIVGIPFTPINSTIAICYNLLAINIVYSIETLYNINNLYVYYIYSQPFQYHFILKVEQVNSSNSLFNASLNANNFGASWLIRVLLQFSVTSK